MREETADILSIARRLDRVELQLKNLTDALVTERSRDFTKPFLNTTTAAAFTDSPSPNAFRMWAKRRGIPCGHKGRTVIYRKSDLELAMGFRPYVTRARP